MERVTRRKLLNMGASRSIPGLSFKLISKLWTWNPCRHDSENPKWSAVADEIARTTGGKYCIIEDPIEAENRKLVRDDDATTEMEGFSGPK